MTGMLRRSRVGLALCPCLVGWAGPGWAESEVHVGLETSIYSNTSIEGTATVNGVAGASANEVKISRKGSTLGLPGYSSLTAGFILGDNFDLGARLNYLKHTADSGDSSLETSEFGFTPYLAYLSGSHGDDVRAVCGATALAPAVSAPK